MPEVRVRDVVDGEDVQIYRALAGGVTTARLLHGSANVHRRAGRGHQAEVRRSPAKRAARRPTARAASSSPWARTSSAPTAGSRTRRLGVEAVLDPGVHRGPGLPQDSGTTTRSAKQDGKPCREPRRDLRLEALADILDGDLQGPLPLLPGRRDPDAAPRRRPVRLQGQVAAARARRLQGRRRRSPPTGRACSLFTDWWAYKIEAFDAIPYAAALLHEAGASVCLKSDSERADAAPVPGGGEDR